MPPFPLLQRYCVCKLFFCSISLRNPTDQTITYPMQLINHRQVGLTDFGPLWGLEVLTGLWRWGSYPLCQVAFNTLLFFGKKGKSKLLFFFFFTKLWLPSVKGLHWQSWVHLLQKCIVINEQVSFCPIYPNKTKRQPLMSLFKNTKHQCCAWSPESKKMCLWKIKALLSHLVLKYCCGPLWLL